MMIWRRSASAWSFRLLATLARATSSRCVGFGLARDGAAGAAAGGLRRRARARWHCRRQARRAAAAAWGWPASAAPGRCRAAWRRAAGGAAPAPSGAAARLASPRFDSPPPATRRAARGDKRADRGRDRGDHDHAGTRAHAAGESHGRLRDWRSTPGAGGGAAPAPEPSSPGSCHRDALLRRPLRCRTESPPWRRWADRRRCHRNLPRA